MFLPDDVCNGLSLASALNQPIELLGLGLGYFLRTVGDKIGARQTGHVAKEYLRVKPRRRDSSASEQIDCSV
jgi:hypothetical protein